MPDILFASNNITHFPLSVAGAVAGTFDSARVPYGIQLSNYQVLSSPDFIPSGSTVTWFHFRYFSDDVVLAIPVGNPGTLFQCFDSLNRQLLRISKKDSDRTLTPRVTLHNGTTTVVVDGTIPMGIAIVNAIDIQLTVSFASITVNVYVNGGLSATASFGSNPNGLTNPTRFVLGTAYAGALVDTAVFSEILVANGDTRNARMNFLRPTATGALSQWDGSVATLGDDNPATGILTTTAAERHTMDLTDYVGPANISNVVTVSQTTRGDNSPTKLKHTIRLSTVNYDSADLNIGFPLQYNIVDSPINPATSLAWVSSDLSTLETGFLSVA